MHTFHANPAKPSETDKRRFRTLSSQRKPPTTTTVNVSQETRAMPEIFVSGSKVHHKLFTTTQTVKHCYGRGGVGYYYFSILSHL